MENITAEEFFRAKIKELNPIQMVVTLANETISGEQGLRWAHEFKELHTTTLQAELEKAKELISDAKDQITFLNEFVSTGTSEEIINRLTTFLSEGTK